MAELHRKGDSSTLSEGKLASGADSVHNSWQTEIEVGSISQGGVLWGGHWSV